MIVKIQDKEPVELRFTFNALVEYEKKYDKPMTVDSWTLDEMLWFYYFVVLCSKKGWNTNAWLTKEEFDEWLNEDPTVLNDLADFVVNNMNLNDVLSKDKKKQN